MTEPNSSSEPPRSGQPVILFDGECNLCNASVDLVMKYDSARVFRLGSLQSDAGGILLESFGFYPDVMESIVLVDGAEVFRESDAVLRIARRLDGPWPLLGVLRIVPRFIRDPMYRWIARNRYRWFGRRNTCRVPSPRERERFIDP